MNEITFHFRPMPNMQAPLREASLSVCGPFVIIDAIDGHPLCLTGPVAHILSGALRDARNELRKVEVLK